MPGLKSGSPSPDDNHASRDDRLKLLLLSLGVVLMVGQAVALGSMENPIATVADLGKSLLTTRLGLAAAAALAASGAVAFVFYRRNRPVARTAAASVRSSDPLTRLLDRQGLIARLDTQIAIHSAQGRQIALHLVDVDRFSSLNLLGEAHGQGLLRAIAEELLGLTEDPGLVARTGDDEFAVIQPEAGGARDAEIFARRVQEAVHEACRSAGHNQWLNASIGVAVGSDQGEDALALFRKAALALDAVKTVGGGAFRLFSRHMDHAGEERRQLEKVVGEAFREGWFELHFQPQYDFATRRLVAFEALARLNHPALGTLLPNDFLPAVRNAGLMSELGEWVLREAISVAANWPPHLKLAVNICPEELRGEFAGRLADVLELSGFAPQRLQLEMLEAAFASASPNFLQQVHALATKGVTVVIDDFGVGSSSLQALVRSGCRAVKMDRSFVKSLGKSGETDALVRALVATAKALDLEVMAEGIEQAEQARFLLANGCRIVQGYLFGRPATAGELGAIIAKDVRNAAIQPVPEREPAAQRLAGRSA